MFAWVLPVFPPTKGEHATAQNYSRGVGLFLPRFSALLRFEFCCRWFGICVESAFIGCYDRFLGFLGTGEIEKYP